MLLQRLAVHYNGVAYLAEVFGAVFLGGVVVAYILIWYRGVANGWSLIDVNGADSLLLILGACFWWVLLVVFQVILIFITLFFLIWVL